MDDKSTISDDIIDVRSPPARPPPPSKLKSADSTDLQAEKSSPKRPSQPKKSSPQSIGIPISVQKHLDELRELQKSKVRWFYKEGKKWIPFNGRDSLVIEDEWQDLQDRGSSRENCHKPTVRGRLFEVDVAKRICLPLYWKGISFSYFL